MIPLPGIDASADFWPERLRHAWRAAMSGTVAPMKDDETITPRRMSRWPWAWACAVWAVVAGGAIYLA